jgi:hypothetical protein
MKSEEVLEILTEVVSTCNAQVWTLSHEQLDKFAEVVYMRGRIEGAAAEREAQTRAYYKGLREGVSNYAYWRDGVQHVGTTGRTLKEAIGDIDREEKDLLKRYGVER